MKYDQSVFGCNGLSNPAKLRARGRAFLFAGMSTICVSLGAMGFSSRLMAASPSPSPTAGHSSPASISVSAGAAVGDTGSGVGSSVTAAIESKGPEITDPDVVARIGTTDIRVEEMRKMIESLKPSEQTAAAADRTLLLQIIKTMMVEQVVYKEAVAKQWDKRPDVAANLEKIRETALVGRFLTDQTQPAVGYPSDAELKEAYEENKAALSVPSKFRIAQIFIALPANANHDASLKAATKLQKISEELGKQDADFAKLAHEYSDEPATAERGGEMGWVDQDKMPPLIKTEALKLGVNMISQPIKISDGWHIIKVLETKDPMPIAFEDIKEKLAQSLRARRADEDRRAFVADLLKKNPVSINDQALKGLLQKTTN